MGWMASWIAVKGVPKAALFEALGVRETDEEVYPGTRGEGLGYAQSPDGWIILFSEEFDWADRERVLELSRLGPTVGLQFEDKIEMTSVATGARDGVELWRVYHDNAGRELEVSGEPPPEFAAIRDRLFKEQADAAGETLRTDYLHDIPLEVAKAACGYRADDWEEPFIGLEDPLAAARAAELAAERAARPGFFSRLFGRRG